MTGRHLSDSIFSVMLYLRDDMPNSYIIKQIDFILNVAFFIIVFYFIIQ